MLIKFYVTEEDTMDKLEKFINFYHTALKYLDQWTGHLGNFKNVDCTLLKSTPQWTDIQPELEFLVDRNILLKLGRQQNLW